ncbi:MAG: DinB family protein [Thermomicrobiales bacterium]
MATREEIVGAINQGIESVNQTFGGLTDEQLATEVYENGWTAKEILAHLAGRQSTYDMVLHMARGGEMPQSADGDFDVDSWNQQVVDEYSGKSRDELLSQFRTVHESLAEQVKDLDDDTLAATVVTPRGEMPASDILVGSGGMHSTAHSNDVAEALGLNS